MSTTVAAVPDTVTMVWHSLNFLMIRHHDEETWQFFWNNVVQAQIGSLERSSLWLQQLLPAEEWAITAGGEHRTKELRSAHPLHSWDSSCAKNLKRVRCCGRERKESPYNGLEKRLHGYKPMLLLQKAQVWFPAPTWRSSQTFVTAASWDLLPLGLHWHLHSHTYVRIIKNKLKKKKQTKNKK